MSRLRAALPWIAILVLAAAVRAPSLTAARPYINYVDEGNYLHVSARMLRDGRWLPDVYLYPSLPIEAVALVARAGGPLYRLTHGHGLRRDVISKLNHYYDVLEPFELLLLGRVLSFLCGLGAVLLTGFLAQRVAGRRSGLLAAFLAALLPGLVIRGGIAMVDTYATLFVAACLLLTERVHSSQSAVAAGAMAGLAFASKYPAVLVALSFALTVGLNTPSWRERLRLWTLGALGAVIAALVAMPGLLLRTTDVLAGIRRQRELYGNLDSPPLWPQIVERAEWDLPFDGPELGWTFVILALAGLVVALGDRRTRASAAGWSLYSIISLALYARQGFQPFRNLLPLLPVACASVAILHARLRERLPRPILADTAAFLLIASLFGPAVLSFASDRAQLRDSRTETVDWLVRQSRPGQTVLVLDHLAFLPSELKRLPGRDVEVVSWPWMQQRLKRNRTRFLVLSQMTTRDGQPLIPYRWRQILFRRYTLRARFGEEPALPNPGVWHGNRQTIYVLERKRQESHSARGGDGSGQVPEKSSSTRRSGL
jgi:dolichyl-phosphate-mannose-protein mannosyltransferase